LTVRAFHDQSLLASQILADAGKQINRLQLPPGYRIEYGGEDENQRETFGEMRIALGISLVLIFLILLLQFRTLADALVVMVAFPLALPGAAFGLFVTHNTFGLTAFIGVISLGGLAVRNSIILVDYIHERMKDGVPLEQAALEAGERRLRPIVLTTLAAAVGVTPMILSGSSLWSPMASVIAFGMLGSMFFTLVVIPVLFVVVKQKGFSKPAVAVVTVALLLLGFSTPSQAQQRPITLDKALQMAMQKNSTVRLAELRAKEADAKVMQARANYFPVATNQTYAIHAGEREFLTIPAGSLGVYSATGPIPGTDEKIPLGKQDFVMSTTTVAQPVSQIFKIHAGVSAAEAEARMAHLDLDRARNEVWLNVKKLYYGLLCAQQRERAAALRLEAGESRLKEAKDAAQSGVVLQVQVLQSQAQIAESRHAQGSIEDQIADMRNSFNDLVGLPLETSLDLIEPASSPAKNEQPDTGAGAPEAEALKHNPELLTARQTLVKARAGLHAAREEYIPDISLVLTHVYQNGVPLLPDSSAAVGLRADWTILEFGGRIGKVRERKAQAAEAEENLRATEKKVRMDVESGMRKVNRSETGVEAAREGVAARAEIVRITNDQVVAKTATESTLEDAQAQLADAKAMLYEAESQRAIAQAELVRTEGRQ
jgi:outer membrane protein TolC